MFSRTYGVSSILGFPFFIRGNGPREFLKWIYPLGYKGIQVSPLRGWKDASIKWVGHFVISQEDSFGEVDLLSNLARRDFRNLLLFSRNHIPNGVLPNAMKCSHEWARGTVLEIYPDLETFPHVYLNKYDKGEVEGFCVDTYHLLRLGRNGETLPWRQLLQVLPPESIRLIHIQPVGIELRAFLSGQDCYTARILKILGQKGVTAPAIVEIRDYWFYRQTLRGRAKVLSRVLAESRRYLD